jgi:UPF0271 protein
MRLAPEEAEALVLYQVGALAGFARAEGVEIGHTKPHGALYNQAAGDRQLAAAIGRAASRFSREVVLVGLAGSPAIEVWQDEGLRVAREGFPDRAYAPDGTLHPRNQAGAVIEDPQAAATYGLRLAKEGITFVWDGKKVHSEVDTLCIHGDTPGAAGRAKALRQVLEADGIELRVMGSTSAGE